MGKIPSNGVPYPRAVHPRMADGGTLTAAYKTRLTVAAVPGATLLNVTDSSAFSAGDLIVLPGDSTPQPNIVASVPDATHISLTNPTGAAFASPAPAPIATEVPNTSVLWPAATSYIGYTYVSEHGEGSLSSVATLVRTGGMKVTAVTDGDLPVGVDGVNWYYSEVAGDQAHMSLINIGLDTWGALEIGAAPVTTGALSPLVNAGGVTLPVQSPILRVDGNLQYISGDLV